jgi:hypothetical protein
VDTALRHAWQATPPRGATCIERSPVAGHHVAGHRVFEEEIVSISYSASASVRDVARHVPAPAGVASSERLATIEWIFRLAVAACFVGHGAFGIITKAAWLPYFALFGIPEAWAWRLMPVVGAVDIGVGILTLFAPVRAVLLYMAFWGFQTAMLRPLAGEGIWEFLERAGNYGVPFAFLMMAGFPDRLSAWLTPVRRFTLDGARAHRIAWVLRVATAALLIGHGGFGAFMHKNWQGYFDVLGIGTATAASLSLTETIGWFEILLGLAVLARPAAWLLVAVFAWKVGTELLRPLAGEPFWEFVERGGSYAAPLLLLLITPRRAAATVEAEDEPEAPAPEVRRAA